MAHSLHGQNNHTNGHLTTSSKIDYNSIVCLFFCLKQSQQHMQQFVYGNV